VLVDRRGAQHVVIQFKAIEKTVLPHSSDCTIIEQLEWVLISRTTSEDPTQRRKCRPQTQQKSETRYSIACVETAHMNDEGVVVQVPRYQQWQLMQTGRQRCVVQRESNRMN